MDITPEEAAALENREQPPPLPVLAENEEDGRKILFRCVECDEAWPVDALALLRAVASRLWQRERGNPSMKYGYARISTIDQNADMQLKALQRAGVEVESHNSPPTPTAHAPALKKSAMVSSVTPPVGIVSI